MWTVELLTVVALLCGSNNGNTNYRASAKLDCPSTVIYCVDKRGPASAQSIAECTKEIGR